MFENERLICRRYHIYAILFNLWWNTLISFLLNDIIRQLFLLLVISSIWKKKSYILAMLEY
jgi:hypothetical protein